MGKSQNAEGKTMKINKGTSCFLSETGHYNIFYMSDKISHFNQDCIVEIKPFTNIKNRKYIAVQTELKNVGVDQLNTDPTLSIIVWIENT